MRLLFDLDGTLTNPFLGFSKSVQFALQKLGRETADLAELAGYIGPPLGESFAALLKTSDEELIAEAVRLYRERYGSIGLFENEVYSGIAHSLQVLSEKGYEMSVATSKPSLFARQIIEHFELGQYFSAIDGCELDGTRGDKSSLIAHISQRDGLVANEVLMIGDRKYDVLGAAENGMRALGVLWGFGSRDELSGAGAIACVDKPEELPQVVAALLSA